MLMTVSGGLVLMGPVGTSLTATSKSSIHIIVPQIIGDYYNGLLKSKTAN